MVPFPHVLVAIDDFQRHTNFDLENRHVGVPGEQAIPSSVRIADMARQCFLDGSDRNVSVFEIEHCMACGGCQQSPVVDEMETYFGRFGVDTTI